jgi:hypothetical protein
VSEDFSPGVPLASMNQARSDFGLVVLDGKLYAVGGFDVQINYPLGGFVDTMEIYDPSTVRV